MKPSEIPDKRKVFVGVDCRDDKIQFGIVNSYGNLLSAGSTLLPTDTTKLGEHIAYTIKALRGGANVRMKNFAGIGVSFAKPELKPEDIEDQITQKIDVPVYIEGYENVRQVGQDWLEHLGDNAGIPKKTDVSELYAVYGLVKRMKEKSSLNVGTIS